MRLAFVAAFAVILLAQEEKLPSLRSGNYEVGLRLPPDGLYAGEEMQIEFRVVDLTQVDPVLGPTPIVRARTRSAIMMPAMPGMPRLEETAHVEGVPGEYGVHPSFSHGGDYVLELSIEPPGGKEFHVKFPLQVADEAPRKHKPQPKPWSVELKASPKAPKAGEAVDLQFLVHYKDKPKEIYSKFEIQHEKPAHLLIVRSDLGTFAHEHPDPQAEGSFREQFTFPSAGEYHLFLDIAPRGAGSQVLMARLKVSGKPGERYTLTQASHSQQVNASGMSIRLRELPVIQTARKTIALTFDVADSATSKPLTDLDPYLGAMGHLILLYEDGLTLVHSHPDERIPNVGHDGVVPFMARFPKEGLYRGWVQFKRHGEVTTGDFVIRVGETAETSEK